MNLAEGDDHVPKTLTNTEPQRKPKIPDSLSIALKNGGPVVWASCLIMGLANILNGQLIMGLIYLAVEIGVIVFLAVPNGGLYWSRRCSTKRPSSTSTLQATSPS